MIRSFADRDTEQIYNGERSRKLPPNIQRSAQHKLRILSNAATPETLKVPPGNHFEALNARPGFYSIRINRQWRITFSWKNGAENVKIEDYH